jgi:hypothetical protein
VEEFNANGIRNKYLRRIFWSIRKAFFGALLNSDSLLKLTIIIFAVPGKIRKKIV